MRALIFVLFLALPALADTRVGLVIGNNASPVGEPDLKALRYADDDALRFRALFVRAAGEVETLAVLDDETARRHPRVDASAPTKVELMRAVAKLKTVVDDARARGERTSAMIFFSGHGATRKDGEPYLALVGGELTGKELYDDVIAGIGADRSHLIVDACNAGAVVGARGKFDDARSAAEVELSDAALARLTENRVRPDVGILIAASAGQKTHEWSRIESGVFSHEVLSALLGPGDVNGDGRVEYSEIQAFVSAANSRIQDPRARPTVIARPPKLDPRLPRRRPAHAQERRVVTGPVRRARAIFRRARQRGALPRRPSGARHVRHRRAPHRPDALRPHGLRRSPTRAGVGR